jgi:hypothetical protein
LEKMKTFMKKGPRIRGVKGRSEKKQSNVTRTLEPGTP